MTYRKQRSWRASLEEGCVDGKYIRMRPDTETSSMNALGDSVVAQERKALNPLNGFATFEYQAKVNPGGD